MRLFVAIDIARQVQERIGKLQQRLKRDLNLSGRDVKWVRPEQIHLTLKFLGQVEDNFVTQVCDVVKRTASECDEFDFQVKGTGVFGRPARVVWAGIEKCKPLQQLQATMEKEFESLGFLAEDRAFEGHLTLCRVKKTPAGRKLAEAMIEYADESFGSVCADSIVVYQSKLTSAGPEYSVVASAAMK
ncbi:MAG: RNA 2',3'-cyclic phosphodiesterase [Planctomycetota bacterium]|jgi:2'-5' RNA ligase